jgi:hemoglobin/transferrin/lactoferrin receptor protein
MSRLTAKRLVLASVLATTMQIALPALTLADDTFVMPASLNQPAPVTQPPVIVQPPMPPLPVPTAPTTQPPIVVEPGTVDLGPQPSLMPNVTNPGDYIDPNTFNEITGTYPSLSQQRFVTGGTVMPGATSADRGLGLSVFDNPSHVTVVDSQRLNERNASDMYRALQNEVGILVQATGRGQAAPFIRGLTGQDVVILIDGVRVNNSTFRAGPNQYFNTIDPGMVERVEVVRGAQSVMWGSDALGGVINVITKSPNRNQGTYGQRGAHEIFSTADMGTYTRFDGEAWSGDQGIYGGASYLNVNNLEIGGSRGKQPFTDFDQYAGDLKYQYLLDTDSILTVSLQHFEQNGLPRSDRFSPFIPLARPTFFDVQQRDLVAARIDGLSNNTLFDAYSFTTNYSRQKEAVTETRLNNNGTVNRRESGEFDVNSLGFTMTLVKEIGESKLSYGGDYSYDDVDAYRIRTNGNNNVPIVPPAAQTPQFPDNSIYDRAGAYAMLDIPVTERLSVLPGIRYENANARGTTRIGNNNVLVDRTYQDWIASISSNYKLTEEVALVGGYYEGYRAPNLDDLFSDVSFAQGQFQTISSVNIAPQYSQTYEVGMKVNGESFRWQIFQYWNNINNYIARYPVNNVGQFNPTAGTVTRDNSDAYLYGTELGGELLLDNWGYDGWSLYGNGFYTYGVDLGTNQVGAPSEPYPRIPPLQGTLGLRWRAPESRRWIDMYVWMVDRADRYSLLNSQDARFIPGGTPGYATLNLRAGRSFGQHDNHRLSVGLENITDKYYRVLGSGVEGAGINAIIGYDYWW